MIRVVMLATMLSTVLPAAFASGQPADLLDQAIEESQALQAADAGASVRSLIEEGDRHAEARRWSEAIRVYSKAYRLAPSDQGNYRRLLLAKRAAGQLTADERQALTVLREREVLQIDHAFREVQLDIIQARQALKEGDAGLARTKHDHARKVLSAIPSDVDTSVYARQLTALNQTIQRKAARPGAANAVPAAPIEQSGVAANPPAPATAAPPKAHPPLLLSDAATETGEVIDVQSLMDDSQRRHAYDYDINNALRKTRADWLIANNEAALPPHPAAGDMGFPADWRERTARRTRFRDGVIQEGAPFTGPDGKTYVTTIYDLGDLVHPVPNFMASYPGTSRQQRNEDLDRTFLRFRSQIFGGYPEDLAQGLPLLHFFGGINNNAISPRYDAREQERIMTLIEQFIQAR